MRHDITTAKFCGLLLHFHRLKNCSILSLAFKILTAPQGRPLVSARADPNTLLQLKRSLCNADAHHSTQSIHLPGSDRCLHWALPIRDLLMLMEKQTHANESHLMASSHL